MVRTWWQMSRPVTPDEADLVPDPAEWDGRDVTFRRVRRAGTGMPEDSDLRELHEVLEGAFVDHFNSYEETFEEFLHRVREDPGHRWDHWWLAELNDGPEPQPVGALIGTVSESSNGPDGSYVSYIGVLESARGRGVAKGLLRTIIADAASRGRNRVGLEVDADSSTGAHELYSRSGLGRRRTSPSRGTATCRSRGPERARPPRRSGQSRPFSSSHSSAAVAAEAFSSPSTRSRSAIRSSVVSSAEIPLSTSARSSV